MLKVVRHRQEVEVLKNGPSYEEGISFESTGSNHLCLQKVVFEPFVRAEPHYHSTHDTAIYVLQGELEIWYGKQLEGYKRLSEGDMLFIPEGLPHCPGNPGNGHSVSLLARNYATAVEPRERSALSPFSHWMEQVPLPQEYMERMLSWQGGQKALQLSLPQGLDVVDCYALQKAWVAACVSNGQSISGYKTALNSKVLQERFGSASPLSAVLLSNGVYRHGGEVSLNGYVTCGLEMEVAFQLSQEVCKEVKELEELQQLIGRVAAAAELPEVGYTDFEQLRAPELVASNIGSKGFAIGPSIPFSEFNAEKVKADLYHGSEKVDESFTSAMLENLMDLLNDLLAIGYPLQPGQWLLSGLIGRLHMVSPGAYKVEMTGLPSLSFTFTP